MRDWEQVERLSDEMLSVQAEAEALIKAHIPKKWNDGDVMGIPEAVYNKVSELLRNLAQLRRIAYGTDWEAPPYKIAFLGARGTLYVKREDRK